MAEWMTFLLGRQAMLGQAPPRRLSSMLATRWPWAPRVQARYFPAFSAADDECVVLFCWHVNPPKHRSMKRWNGCNDLYEFMNSDEATTRITVEKDSAGRKA